MELTNGKYCIDLDRKLEIMAIEQATIDTDEGRECYGRERHVFNSYEDARRFKDAFNKARDGLEMLSKSGHVRVLLKRYYLTLIDMGLKRSTKRTYKIKAEIGDQIIFHDQTYQVAVKLTAISEVGKGCYEYHFKKI